MDGSGTISTFMFKFLGHADHDWLTDVSHFVIYTFQLKVI